jgi:hypothetical protein
VGKRRGTVDTAYVTVAMAFEAKGKEKREEERALSQAK